MHGLNPISAEAPMLLAPTEALLRGFELATAPAAAAAPENEPGGVRRSALPSIDGLQARQGFRVGMLNLMIRYADGSELIELPPMHRLPNAPPWLPGMVNLHGMLVPVFDLARWLGIERPAAKPMLLVLAHGADAAGIVIDGLPERLRWSAGQTADTATVPEALAPVVQRAVLIGERLWFDLDTPALLVALEQSLGARP
jgi:chemotaxis signal transduction protein